MNEFYPLRHTELFPTKQLESVSERNTKDFFVFHAVKMNTVFVSHTLQEDLLFSAPEDTEMDCKMGEVVCFSVFHLPILVI